MEGNGSFSDGDRTEVVKRAFGKSYEPADGADPMGYEVHCKQPDLMGGSCPQPERKEKNLEKKKVTEFLKP